MSEDDENGPAPGRSVPHPKRHYEERQRHRLKDVDSADRVMKAKALVWSCGVVVIGFAALSLAGGGALETKMLWLVRSGILAAAVFVYFAALAIAGGGGSLAGTIYHPSGKSTPVKHEYSFAESLAARGRYEEAVEAYEVAISEFPEDPEPYVRIARLLRDKTAEYEDAVHWFKRARGDSAISKGQELVVTQEIIEIYRSKLGTPSRAIPELARIVDRFPDERAAAWAREEMTRLRRQVAADERERSG